MVTRTDEWLRAYQARQYHPETLEQIVGAEEAKLESDLHDEIIDECKRRNWIYFHGSMAHRTHRTLNEPDFIILADRGRTFYFEAKREGVKLPPGQLGLKMWAEKLGHPIHTIRSFEAFLRIVAEPSTAPAQGSDSTPAPAPS